MTPAADVVPAAAVENFRVSTSAPSFPAHAVKRECDAWRAALIRHWGFNAPESWSVACEVVIHSNRAAYRAAVGPGSDATFGSSLIEFKDKQVSRRRLDLLPDAQHELSALGHELTHVLLADCFSGRQPPRWLDEGIAVLADRRDKQDRHLQDATQAVADRSAFRIGELLAVESYPGRGRMGAFYGQSASLAVMLAQRDDPSKMIVFMQHAFEHGYDAALRQVYHINGVAELDPLWRTHHLAARSYNGLKIASADDLRKLNATPKE